MVKFKYILFFNQIGIDAIRGKMLRLVNYTIN
jgi:hypothetical protein